jgi:hypothetical protein
VLLSSGDSFPHLIKKRRSQLGFVTYLLNYPRSFFFNIIDFFTSMSEEHKSKSPSAIQVKNWRKSVSTKEELDLINQLETDE